MGSLPLEERIEATPRRDGPLRPVRSTPCGFIRVRSGGRFTRLRPFLRMADMADATLAHMAAHRDQEAAAALRNLYEMVVTLVWVADQIGSNGGIAGRARHSSSSSSCTTTSPHSARLCSTRQRSRLAKPRLACHR